MTENVIKYKGQYLTYSKIADEIILDYGCSSDKQLHTLLYLGTGVTLCEAEMSIIRDLYNYRVECIRTSMNSWPSITAMISK